MLLLHKINYLLDIMLVLDKLWRSISFDLLPLHCLTVLLIFLECCVTTVLAASITTASLACIMFDYCPSMTTS